MPINIAEGDKIVQRVTTSARHTGELFGIPATGKSFQVEGIEIYHLANNKIVESWSQYDMLGLFPQLGIEMGAPG